MKSPLPKISKQDQQFILAVVLVIAGLVLIFFGFFTDPRGEISPSVLTAFGETLTFCGAVIGLDFQYRSKLINRTKNHEDHEELEKKEDAVK